MATCCLTGSYLPLTTIPSLDHLPRLPSSRLHCHSSLALSRRSSLSLTSPLTQSHVSRMSETSSHVSRHVSSRRIPSSRSKSTSASQAAQDAAASQELTEEEKEEEEREGREIEKLKAGMGERRAVDRSERLQENPYIPVESTMASPAVTTTADALVSSLLESLEHFTGLPVVDEAGKCVGIVSAIDIFEHQRKGSKSITQLRVRDVMSTPAVVIVQHAPIAYAAGLMLKHKVHRLPVVDGNQVVVGIVTRTDIYEPLIPEVNPMLHRLVGGD